MPSFSPNPEHLMSEVYSYPFPEVRELLRHPRVDPNFMLNTIAADEASILLEPYGFIPRLELPTRRDGSLDLDELHLPVIDRISAVLTNRLPGLESFDYAYPGHGSSQAIFNLLAEWKAKGKLDSVAVLDGEYEGYKAYANSLSIAVQTHVELNNAPVKEGQVWFISNPNARLGNWLDGDAWRKFVNSGHQIVLDTAYVGLAQDGKVDVRSPNIRAVLTSPSKAYGVFRYRNTGIAYAREPIESLYGTKWFKDIPALLDTLRLYEQFGTAELPRRYRNAQEFICRSLVDVIDVEVQPSDVLLLGNAIISNNPQLERFIRAGKYRFGLTQLFEDYEKV